MKKPKLKPATRTLRNHPKELEFPFVAMTCDPGSLNYGIAIQKFTLDAKKRMHVELLYASLYQDPIHSLRDMEPGMSLADHKELSHAKKRQNPLPFSVERKRFRAYMTGLVKRYAVQAIAMERFQSRGLRGSQGELVSTMNALLVTVADDQHLVSKLFIASEWKNSFSRILGKKALENLYLDAQKKGLAAHYLDARLIGIYLMQMPWLDVLGSKAKQKKFIADTLNI